MPIFDSAKGDVPYSQLPNSTATQFGSGTIFMREEGTLGVAISGTGVTPGSTGNDNVLAVFTLPANSFDIAGRGICLTALGSFAATVNTKRVKLIVGATTAVVGSAVSGGTTIADTGAVTTNGAGWCISAEVYKFGAAGSNTQIGVHQPTQIGAAVSSLLPPVSLTFPENAPILIAITGNATTAASDIVFNLATLQGLN